MSRGKNVAYSSVANIISEIVSLICGFILPRLILNTYGSSYNGIVSSVTQFLSVIALMRAGIAGATRASLYKSLANKDTAKISATIRATEIFMRRIALIFAGFVVVFSCTYPIFVSDEFEWLFSASLVLIISMSTFVQYMFGITYQMLLQADQRLYITTSLGIITTILNTIVAAVLMKLGCGIHLVKLGSAVVFSFTPIFINIYARKYYAIDTAIEPDFTAIKQRWDAVFHQVAFFIHSNTDIVILTLFANIKEVSVYTVYYLVANGLKRAITSVTSGVEAAFGDMIAKNEEKNLQNNVVVYETLLHFVSSILFGSALVLIIPFVGVYTKGITDVEYIRPVFGALVIITELIFVFRQPYDSIIQAAGHYKQTKIIALFEAVINIVISLVCVIKLGLIGVMIGTVIANIYRNIAYRIYVSRNILTLQWSYHVKRYTVTAITVLLVFAFSCIYPSGIITNYGQWALYAFMITVVAIGIALGLNFIFYKQQMKSLIKKMVYIIKHLK